MSEALPLIDRADGVTLLSTWMITIREDADFADQALARKATDKERAFRFILTLNHETVHFIQGFTTALAYSYSLNLLQLCRGLMEDSRAGALDAARLTEHRNKYSRLNHLLSLPERGVSTVDLLEAMAVTEAFRMTALTVDAASFRNHLEQYWRSGSSYRRVIDIVRDRLGDEVALETTSRLCFLALNGDAPAENFWVFLDGLASVPRQEVAAMSAVELATRFALDRRSGLLSNEKRIAELAARHPVLGPYLEQLCSLAPLDAIFEFAARPSDWLGARRGGPAGVDKLMPPVIVFSGGRGTKLGQAQEWTKEEDFRFFDTTALVGACQRLLGNESYLACPHTACSVHASRLCHAWYAIPMQIDWQQCAFPKRLAVQFARSAVDLVQLAVMAPDPVMTSPPAAFAPMLGRDKEAYRVALNEAGALTDPAEWDRRVITLLREADVGNLTHPLLDNTLYLTMSVAGYLLQMTGPATDNVFEQWMEGSQPPLGDVTAAQVLAIAWQVSKLASPWFGVAILRALQTIYAVPRDGRSRREPVWMRGELERLAGTLDVPT